MLNLFLAVMASFLLLTNFGVAEAAPQTLLQNSLANAKKTDFFTFFDPEPDKVTRNNHGSNLRFRMPTLDQFYPLIWLDVTIDNNSIVRKIDLTIQRIIFDFRPRGILKARELTKSLLEQGLPSVDSAAVVGLTNQISHPPGSVTYDLHSGDVENAPSQIQPGYSVYQGKSDVFEKVLSKSSIKLENKTENGVRMFVVSVKTK